MVCAFAGVPSKLTRPEMVPVPGLAEEEIVKMVNTATAASIAFLVRIDFSPRFY